MPATKALWVPKQPWHVQVHQFTYADAIKAQAVLRDANGDSVAYFHDWRAAEHVLTHLDVDANALREEVEDLKDELKDMANDLIEAREELAQLKAENQTLRNHLCPKPPTN